MLACWSEHDMSDVTSVFINHSTNRENKWKQQEENSFMWTASISLYWISIACWCIWILFEYA